MTPDLADAASASSSCARKLESARRFADRFRRVLLQRAWKVCGTFARAVSQGTGDAYRRYLPAEIELVGRLLGEGAKTAGFEGFTTPVWPLW